MTVKPAYPAASGTDCNSVVKEYGSMVIRIDPRIELLSVAQLLCDGYLGPNGKPILGNLNSGYRRDVLEYFAKFKNHPVAGLTAQMSRHAFWLGHPIRGVLCRGGLPELAPRYQPDGLMLALSGGQDELDRYYGALADFARQSSFEKFFVVHKADYNQMIETFFSGERRNYPEDLEKFFGSTLTEYNLIFSPLNEYSGYGNRILTGEAEYSTSVVVGPVWITEDSLPDFNWKSHNIFWHEFSHPHVNPLVEANIARLLGPCTPLQPVKPEEVAEYGIEWEVQVADWTGEHIVRATVACMMAKYNPERDLDELFEQERKWGFPYVRKVYDALRRYDSNRERYPRFEDYFPEIIAVFEQIAADVKVQGE
jgi:hypothetical protein